MFEMNYLLASLKQTVTIYQTLSLAAPNTAGSYFSK